MWETIGNVLTSANATMILWFLLLVAILLVALMKTGLLSVHTQVFQFGEDIKERDIIRQQVEWAHVYISGLYRMIQPTSPEYNGYFTRYILECVYSEVVDWITFNHIKVDSDYISIKQAKIKALVYSFDVRPEFRTQKFEKQLDIWVEELVRKLALIREVYK